MIKKWKFALFFMLWQGTAQAIELLELLKQISIPPTVSAEVAQKDLYRLTSLMVGCDLDGGCMTAVLTEMNKADPNPIFQSYLGLLQSHQAFFTHEASFCHLEDRVLVHKEMSQCLATELKKSDPQQAPLLDAQAIKQDMNSCFKGRLEALASQGNIFAQDALLNFATNNKNSTDMAHWYSMIEQQKDKPHYEAYQRCVHPGVPPPTATATPASTEELSSEHPAQAAAAIIASEHPAQTAAAIVAPAVVERLLTVDDL